MISDTHSNPHNSHIDELPETAWIKVYFINRDNLGRLIFELDTMVKSYNDIISSVSKAIDYKEEQKLEQNFLELNTQFIALIQTIKQELVNLNDLLKRTKIEEHHRMIKLSNLKFQEQLKVKVKYIQEAKYSYIKICKDRLIRNAEYSYSTANPLLDNGLQVSSSLQIKQVANPEVSEIFNESHARSVQIKQLEQSVMNVYQLMTEISVLCDLQGQKLETINNNIDTSSNYIYKGNKDLIESLTIIKRKRKVTCCITLIVLIILTVITVGVYYGNKIS